MRGTTAHDIRRAEIAWLDDLPEAAWVMDRMITLVARANRDSFDYDLTDFGESAQVARYGAERQGHFDWHSDIGAGNWAAKRKLTIVVQLSDPAGLRRRHAGTAPRQQHHPSRPHAVAPPPSSPASCCTASRPSPRAPAGR